MHCGLPGFLVHCPSMSAIERPHGKLTSERLRVALFLPSYCRLASARKQSRGRIALPVVGPYFLLPHTHPQLLSLSAELRPLFHYAKSATKYSSPADAQSPFCLYIAKDLTCPTCWSAEAVRLAGSLFSVPSFILPSHTVQSATRDRVGYGSWFSNRLEGKFAIARAPTNPARFSL